MSYNPKSMHAEEFIDDAEILEKIVQVVENKINLQKGFYDIYFKTDIEK